MSSGLGIPPTKVRNEEVYDVKVKKPVVHSAPITSLVDYDNEHDEEAPDISTREDPEEMEVTKLQVEENNKENVRLPICTGYTVASPSRLTYVRTYPYMECNID